jgi:hypothetical protein
MASKNPEGTLDHHAGPQPLSTPVQPGAVQVADARNSPLNVIYPWEWGGYTPSEYQDHMTKAISHNLAGIRQMYGQTAGELAETTLERLTSRGPGGHASLTFQAAASEVLLQQANAIKRNPEGLDQDGQRVRFEHLMRSASVDPSLTGKLLGTDTSTQDALLEQSKQLARQRATEILGPEPTFKLFEHFRDANPATAWSAGFVDAITSEAIGGLKQLPVIASNPIEALRQVGYSLERGKELLVEARDNMPSSLREGYDKLTEQIRKMPDISHYDVGYATGAVAFAVLDAKDSIDDIRRVNARMTQVGEKIANGEIRGIGHLLYELMPEHPQAERPVFGERPDRPDDWGSQPIIRQDPDPVGTKASSPGDSPASSNVPVADIVGNFSGFREELVRAASPVNGTVVGPDGADTPIIRAVETGEAIFLEDGKNSFAVSILVGHTQDGSAYSGYGRIDPDSGQGLWYPFKALDSDGNPIRDRAGEEVRAAIQSGAANAGVLEPEAQWRERQPERLPTSNPLLAPDVVYAPGAEPGPNIALPVVRELTPEDRLALPQKEQARLFAEDIGLNGSIAQSFQNAVLESARGGGADVVETMRGSASKLWGEGENTGLLGDALSRNLGIPEEKRAIFDRAFVNVRNHAAEEGGAAGIELVNQIAVPGSPVRVALMDSVNRADPEWRVAQPREAQAALAVEGLGFEGPMKVSMTRALVSATAGGGVDAIEKARTSAETLAGTGESTGVIGVAVKNNLGIAPQDHPAADKVIARYRDENFNSSESWPQYVELVNQLGVPGSDTRKRFMDEVGVHRVAVEMPARTDAPIEVHDDRMREWGLSNTPFANHLRERLTRDVELLEKAGLGAGDYPDRLWQKSDASQQPGQWSNVPGQALIWTLGAAEYDTPATRMVIDALSEKIREGGGGPRELATAYTQIADPNSQQHAAFEQALAKKREEMGEPGTHSQASAPSVSGDTAEIPVSPRPNHGETTAEAEKGSVSPVGKVSGVATEPERTVTLPTESGPVNVAFKEKEFRNEWDIWEAVLKAPEPEPPSVPIRTGFTLDHGLTGMGEGAYTPIGAHGRHDGKMAIVPPGVEIWVPVQEGALLGQDLANAIDAGANLEGIRLKPYRPGDPFPDLSLTPAGNLIYAGDPVTVSGQTRLSDVIAQQIEAKKQQGDWPPEPGKEEKFVIAACMAMRRDGVFGDDLPKNDPRLVTIDLPWKEPPHTTGQNPASPFFPGFNTQHGLTDDAQRHVIATLQSGNGTYDFNVPEGQKPSQVTERFFRMPEGMTLHIPPYGAAVDVELVKALEENSVPLSKVPLVSIEGGRLAPDPWMQPGRYSTSESGDNVVDFRVPTRLSVLINKMHELGMRGDVILPAGVPGIDGPYSGYVMKLDDKGEVLLKLGTPQEFQNTASNGLDPRGISPNRWLPPQDQSATFDPNLPGLTRERILNRSEGQQEQPTQSSPATSLPPIEKPTLAPGASPAPVNIAGVDYNVAGMASDGTLKLVPTSERRHAVPESAMVQPVMLGPTDLKPGMDVIYGGQPWRFVSAERQGDSTVYRLEDKLSLKEDVWVPGRHAVDILGARWREVEYDNKVWTWGGLDKDIGGVRLNRVEPGTGDVAERTISTVVPPERFGAITMRFSDGEPHNLAWVSGGALHLVPKENNAIDYTPPVGFQFEAWLKGREQEGAKTISVQPGGQLSASGVGPNGLLLTETVRPNDVGATYVPVFSTDLPPRSSPPPYIDVEANRYANSDRIAGQNTQPLPETARAQLLIGSQAYDETAKLINDGAKRGDEARLTVFNLYFESGGMTAPVLDAMVNYRNRNPDARMEILAERTRFEQDSSSPGYAAMAKALKDNGIEVVFYDDRSGARGLLNHAKGVIMGEEGSRVLFTTAALLSESQKADISIVLPGPQAREFTKYFDNAVMADDMTRNDRRTTVENLAGMGVLVNDPILKKATIAEAQDQLIAGAQNSLLVQVSELRDPERTRQLIAHVAESEVGRVKNDPAAPPFKLEIFTNAVDPVSMRMLQDAMDKFPDSISVTMTTEFKPKPHYNLVVADEASPDKSRAYVGTAFNWSPQERLIHPTAALDNGVLIQGRTVQELMQSVRELHREQMYDPIHYNRSNSHTAPASATDTAAGQVPRDARTGAGLTASAEPQTPAAEGTLRAKEQVSGWPAPGSSHFQLYSAVGDAVDAMNARLGVPPGEHSQRLTAALLEQAIKGKLETVDTVALSQPTLDGRPAGDRVFAVQTRDRNPEDPLYVSVSMSEVMAKPIGERLVSLSDTIQRANASPAAQQTEEQQQPRKPSEPRLG